MTYFMVLIVNKCTDLYGWVDLLDVPWVENDRGRGSNNRS